MRHYAALMGVALLGGAGACADINVPSESSECLKQACGAADCADAVKDQWCFIDRMCFAQGQTMPGAPCLWCDPSTSKVMAVDKCGGPCSESGSCAVEDAVTTDADTNVSDLGPEDVVDSSAGIGCVGPPPICLSAGVCATAASSILVCDASGWRCDYNHLSAHELDEEACDGLDNDCDGVTDEGHPNYDLDDEADCVDTDDDNDGDPDPTDCAPLNAAVARSAIERCNGLDDDCDGSVDENWPSLGQSCDGTDADLCEYGQWVCDTDGLEVSCSDGPTTAAEVCNGLDDDCDGLVDNGFMIGAACDGDDADQCAFGEIVCGPDGTSVCDEPPEAAAEELCDGADNDCDGLIDEDFPALNQPCDSKDTDLCANGIATCASSGLETECAFENETPPNIQEVCDGIDNDCDGVTDEGCGR